MFTNREFLLKTSKQDYPEMFDIIQSESIRNFHENSLPIYSWKVQRMVENFVCFLKFKYLYSSWCFFGWSHANFRSIYSLISARISTFCNIISHGSLIISYTEHWSWFSIPPWSWFDLAKSGYLLCIYFKMIPRNYAIVLSTKISKLVPHFSDIISHDCEIISLNGAERVARDYLIHWALISIFFTCDIIPQDRKIISAYTFGWSRAIAW